MQLLDPDVAGDVDFGGRAAPQWALGPLQVARGLLRPFGPSSGKILVSHPINGRPGVLAFRGNRLIGVLVLEERAGRITHVHAIADRRQLASLGTDIGSGLDTEVAQLGCVDDHVKRGDAPDDYSEAEHRDWFVPAADKECTRAAVDQNRVGE